VWETLVLRFKDRARFVRSAEVESWRQLGAMPGRTSLHNLAQASGAARFLQHFTPHGPLVVAESRDGLDAARLFLPGLHDVLAPILGDQFLVSTPHRDTLLAAPASSAGLLAELQARTDAAVRGAPHAISSRLWLVKGPGRIQPVTRAH
jgi:hypothetical protein